MSSLTSGPTGSGEDPITANVNLQKKKKLDTWIIVVVLGSSLTLIVACAGLIILIVKWRKLKRLHEAGSPAMTPAAKRRYGNVNSFVIVNMPSYHSCLLCINGILSNSVLNQIYLLLLDGISPSGLVWHRGVVVYF
jgi:hypothetical protein